MSLASNLRARGFDRLLQSSGQDCSFRGKAVRAVVEYGSQQGRDMMEVSLALLSTSEIEFRKDAVQSAPVIGEVLTDEESQKHRITLIRQSQFTWRVMCEVSS